MHEMSAWEIKNAKHIEYRNHPEVPIQVQDIISDITTALKNYETSILPRLQTKLSCFIWGMWCDGDKSWNLASVQVKWAGHCFGRGILVSHH